jgi:hypothetical protein
MAQLYEFKKRLKDMQSMKDKAKLKATMLPEMAPIWTACWPPMRAPRMKC